MNNQQPHLFKLLVVALALMTPFQAQPVERPDSLASAPDPGVLTGTRTIIPINIVSNGDFEVPDVESITFDTYYAGQTFGDWTVDTGSIDHISERHWQSADGRQSVDLTGTSDGTPGIISQYLFTPVGQTYLFRFALSGNPEGGPAVKQLEVWWGTTLVDTLYFDVTGHSNWQMGWSYHQYLITSFNPFTRLTFKSRTSGYYGPVLDAVSVRATSGPIPLLEFPVDYTNSKFASVALGNTGKNPGRVNSWFDHLYPNYTTNMTVTVWTGSIYTSTYSADLNATNCQTGISCYNGHNGVDIQYQYIGQNKDEMVYPAATGVVTEVHRTWPQRSGARGGSYGNYVLIDHGGGYATFYAHLKSVNPAINFGTPITDTRAITVGIMGGSGGFPIHLHFGLYYDADSDGQWEEKYRGSSEAVDPYGWFGAYPDPWSPQSLYLWKHPLWDSATAGSYGAILTSPSGKGKFTFPPGALGYTVTLELWDVSTAGAIPALRRPIGHAVWLRIPDWLSGNDLRLSSSASFSQPVTANLRYEISETQHLDTSQLQVYQWRESVGEWSALVTSVDYNLREASVQTLEPGTFSLQAPLLCAEVAEEPNDTLYTAGTITTNGIPVSQLFDIQADEDWFTFQAWAGGRYVFTTSVLSAGVDTLLEIYDIDGITRLDSDDNGGGGLTSSIDWQAPTSGSYFVRARNASGGAFGCDAAYAISATQEIMVYLPLMWK